MSLELWDWRRRMSDLYAAARAGGPGSEPWQRWRAGRDDLFASHPQSPTAPGESPAWFAHDPAWRFEARFDGDGQGEVWRTEEGAFERIGTLRFRPPGAPGEEASLAAWWLQAYGGGLFVPFRDATAGISTYGGGRYLLDTGKGADLGGRRNRLVLDLNFAYNPSCAYDEAWTCPLAPPGNELRTVDLPVGERAWR